MGTLDGQVIMVTGGSRGIGFAVAEALVARGAKVGVLARNADTVEQAVRQLGTEHAWGVSADVTDRAALDRAFAGLAEAFGRVTGTVNNAGFQFARRIEKMPEAEVRKLVDLNFLSAVFSCQAAIPHLRAAGGGRIVNVSSSSVRNHDEFAHIALYSASKAALEHFTESLRGEVKVDGIMVSLVSPGSVHTGSIANFDPEAAAEAMEVWLENGTYCDGFMQPETMGMAIAHCFEYPPGVALEFMEVRPNIRTSKQLEAEQVAG